MNGPDAYKALADPTRRQILKLLREADLPAGAIAEQFDMAWPSVSRHLSILAAAGLVRQTRHGNQVIYSLATSVLADIVVDGRVRPAGAACAAVADTCPVTAYRHWITLAGLVDGPVFRSVPKGGKRVGASLSSRAVADIVKGRAAAGGYSPDAFSPHSLRAGLAAAAAAAGVPERKIMDQTGHRSLAVMRGYIREGELFRGNAAGEVGL